MVLKSYISYIIIGFINILTYFFFLNNSFLNYDDFTFVVENEWVKNLHFSHVQSIFTHPYQGHYQPITWLVYALIYQIGTTSIYFHVVSLLMHIFNGILLYKIFNALSPAKTVLNLLCVLLFSVHPLLSENVFWVSGLNNLLCFFFYASAFYAFLLFQNTLHKKYIWLSFFLFLMALLCKSMAISLPILLLAYSYFILKQKNWKNYVFLVFFFIGSFIFSLLAVKSSDAFGSLEISTYSFSVLEKIILILNTYAFYFLKAIIPTHLSIIHPLPVQIITVQYCIQALFLIVVSIFIILKKKTHPLAFLGLLWFLITLLPVSQIISFGYSMVSERYSYFALPGIILIFYPFLDIWKSKIYIPVLLTATLSLAILTFQRGFVWNNSIHLYENVLESYPQHGYTHYALGVVYQDLHDPAAALKKFSEAEKLGYQTEKLFFSKALIYLSTQQYDLALINFNLCLEKNSNHKQACLNMGNIYFNKQDYLNAKTYYTRCIQIDPQYVEALENRAICNLKMGATPEALEDINAALKIDPLRKKVLALKQKVLQNTAH